MECPRCGSRGTQKAYGPAVNCSLCVLDPGGFGPYHHHYLCTCGFHYLVPRELGCVLDLSRMEVLYSSSLRRRKEHILHLCHSHIAEHSYHGHCDQKEGSVIAIWCEDLLWFWSAAVSGCGSCGEGDGIRSALQNALSAVWCEEVLVHEVRHVPV